MISLVYPYGSVCPSLEEPVCDILDPGSHKTTRITQLLRIGMIATVAGC